MPLINCKTYLELNWIKNCVISDIAGNTEFKIRNTKLDVGIVTLSTENNIKLTKQLNEGFKRSVHWNQYKTEMKSRDLNDQNPLRILLAASFQGVKRLFVLTFNKSTVDVANNPINNTNNRVKKKQSQEIFFSKNRYNQLQYINW